MMQIQAMPPMRFGAKAEKSVKDQVSDHLTKNKVPFMYIYEGLGSKNKVDVFVEEQSQVAEAITSLKKLKGVTAHADENKVLYRDKVVGVWVNVKYELFKP